MELITDTPFVNLSTVGNETQLIYSLEDHTCIISLHSYTIIDFC